MISFKSIFSRIIFLHVIALVITAIVMPVVLYWFFKWAANDLHDQAMRDQAQLVAHYLVLQADGTWTLDLPPALEDIYSQAVGRYAYAVVDDAGRVLLSSSDDRSPIFAADPRSSDIAYLETRRGKAAISGVSLLKDVDGRKVWVQVGEDLAHRDVIVDDIVADFFKRVGWITLPVLLSLLAIDIVIFRRALRPLLNASELAKKINPRRTDIRLPIEQMPKEILPLVQAVNQALDRLEAGFRVQREFTADAAHELRTPLTILRSRVDTLADRGTSEALHKDIEGMARVVNQLLDIAELETLSIDPLEKADLHAICAEVAEFAAPLALAQGKNIALSGSDAAVWVNGNPEMLSRAIRNLVENAVNYSPPGTTVEIVVEDSGMVRVLDEGPGIKEDERELIFQRFWRRDRRRTEGAGLGLSIVRRIADTHAATISVENRPTGGATFSLRFARIA
ncbi:MAG TPA: ATP-binding protein [Xanthobacteraceae bacterium]|nr:ATP-binding protein [Xanthobacteraceae bacterium]